MMEDRIITTDFIEEDYKIENNLRPQLLVDYIGQSASIRAASSRSAGTDRK